MEQVLVMVKPVGLHPVCRVVDNDLKPLQEIVGGYIEVIPYWPPGMPGEIIAFCNDEGKYEGLTTNYTIPGDEIVGDVVFTRSGEEGQTVSLTDDDIKAICDAYGWRLQAG